MGDMGIINYFRHQDRLFALVIIVMAIIMYVIIGDMDEPYSPGALSASTYPRLILICMIISSCLLILRSQQDERQSVSVSFKGLSVIILMVLYIALLETVGFFVLTPIFLFILPLLAGFRRYVLISVSVILVTVILYGVFAWLLNIPLPAGLFGD
jgi:putative tricarboxylic transport membrane protein